MKENMMNLIKERIEKGELHTLRREMELIQEMGFGDVAIDLLVRIAWEYNIDAKLAQRDLERLEGQMEILEDYYGEGVL